MALASKKNFEILVKNSGFSKLELTISEGKSVVFLLDKRKSTSNENNDIVVNWEEVYIIEVLGDEVIDGKYRTVIGGNVSDRSPDRFTVKFKLRGEYYFKLVNHPKNPPLCKIKVVEEIPLSFLITEEGFLPRVIRIEENSAIKWTWTQLSYPHSIYEADFCDAHNGIFRTTRELVPMANSGSYKRHFKDPGLYYFQTEARASDQKHVCIVEVHQSYREHLVEILDNQFSPARIIVEEGDRVLFSWSKDRCMKKHCIYQIEPPQPNHPESSPYYPVKDGFKWNAPTRSGAVWNVFDKCGVYYYSDMSERECASYIGIIVVKQKSEHHVIEYDVEKSSFGIDLLTLETGDSIWWKWNNTQALITIKLTEYSLIGNKNVDTEKCRGIGGCEQLDANGIARSGVRTFNVKFAGIYYFDIYDGDNITTLTIVATSMQKDHKIAISDTDAKPKILEIYPEDRVWFTWDETRKPKNIRQVNHQNQIVENGFLSGSLIESPGTFMHAFTDIGVYFYRTDNLMDLLGAVVVVPEPTIQLVNVAEDGLNPDPIIVHVNDIVIWAFAKYQATNLVLIETDTDLLKYATIAQEVVPRRHLSYAFTEPGIYHFASPAFDDTVDPSNKDATKGLDNTIISSVIVDAIIDHTSVFVDSNGFHPSLINVEVGKNVLFDWESSNQSHNIIHVTMPNDKDNRLKIVEGVTAFNSGEPVSNNRFLHRFDDEGVYCVVSEGAPGSYCIIRVLQKVYKTATPELVNDEPYVLYKYHKIFLDCKTPNSTIHYTLDGSVPSKLSLLYDKENAVIMGEEGINILRAIAFSDENLTSDVFTSQRFYVIPNPEDVKRIYAETGTLEESSASNEDWWQCIPKISYTTVGVGCVELSWETPAAKSLELISHYQLFLNKVTYKRIISPYTGRLVLKDLAGGKNYEAILMVYPKGQHLVPQQSNIITIESPSKTSLGGPVISLKANPNKNQITICWPSIDSKKVPIDYYRLLINGEKREIIKPNVGIHRITIENCKENFKYSIILVAIPKDGSVPLISNELEITLPLELSEITLPDPSLRKLDKDYYNEYIEITEYSIEQTVIDSLKETAEGDAETDEKISPQTAPYSSYDNYIMQIEDKNKLIENDFMVSNVDSDKKIDRASSKKLPTEINNLPDINDYAKILEAPDSDLVNEETVIINSQIISQIAEESTDDELPTPMVGVFHLKSGSISVVWRVDRLPPKEIKLMHYLVSLIGCEFGSSIKSDASFDCNMEQLNGIEVPAIQHTWITKSNSNLENKFTIDGVLDTAIYQITVTAIYRSGDASEFKRTSKIIDYTALGPPDPPRLRVNFVDLRSVTLEWIMSSYAKPDFIKGFRLIVNGEANEIFEKNINEFIFRDMQPGYCYDIEILTLTNWMIGASQPSNKITLICPNRPKSPLITQIPSIRTNSVVIGWKPVDPRSNNKPDQILLYKVFVNRKYHGEIYSTNSSSYSYSISDLTPGKSYDVMVQSFGGERITQPVDSPKVSCIVESEFSNTLPVTPTSLPGPVRLKLATISPDGIDITWTFPQQYGDASCCGYQLVKNSKIYGNVIPPEVNTFRISDVDIGETITLQLICLTNHPIGKYTALHNHPDYTMDQPQREFISNGNDDKTNKVTDIHHSYPACQPGPALSVKFTHLVKPAVKVWSERVTGHTATLFFQTSKMNSHFVDPEYFLISYWPGDKPGDDLQTIKTEKDYVNLSNLKPSTIYSVQVESRRELKRSEDITDLSDKNDYKFITYSKSSLLQFQTASPPDPPTNLSIVSTTCHAIKVAWDPPIDHGSELIATRVDCYPLNTEKPLHIYKELTPDSKCCIIENLSEKTNYRITITAVTEEYFYQHKIKEIKKLPKYILESVPWLPSAHIEGMTSGSDPATNLEWKLKHDNSISLSWKPPKVYGTNQLVNQVICYQEILSDVSTMAVQTPLQPNAKNYKLANIKAGSKYKIWIEAVVCIKLNIDSNSSNLEINAKDYYKELKDHRCINVLSEPLILRIPAPCEPVMLNLTSYSTDTIELYWARPNLYSRQTDPDNPDKQLHVYRHLIGYKLEVNQIQQRTLESNETCCTLTKCKPLHTYSIVIITQTCLHSDAITSDTVVKTEIDVNDIDESFSTPLLVKTFSSDRPDQVHHIGAQYEEIVDTNEPKSIGRIRIDWAIKDDRDVSQFNVIWFSAEESLTLRRSFDPAARTCYIPVTKSKCVYEISLETVYRKSKQTFTTDRLFIEVPGSPDAPTLWLLDQKDNNVTIHWSEPRVYPTVPVTGYQIYANNLKIGAKIDKDILKATLPLKPNRIYKLNVQALTSKAEYPDSELSNTISVSTSLTGLILSNQPSYKTTEVSATKPSVITSYDSGNKFNDGQVISLKKFYENENENDPNDSPLPIRLSKIAEDYIELDWSKLARVDYFDEFKIELHCLNTNEQDVVRLQSSTNNYRIKKLRSGFTYSIRLSTVKHNNVINKSKYLILQTSAPPEAPVPKLRACNFKYITIEWNKPYCFGEAQVVAYKVYVDGKVEAVLSSDQNSFTLSKGEPCHEYTFQVQAVTADENLSSLVSPPLNCIWPGIQVSNLKQSESDSGALRITWDEPNIVGNAKVSYYRVVATAEPSNTTFVQGPLENDVRECEFIGLSLGRYRVNLEVFIFGVTEPFVSKPIYIDYGYKPECPKLYAQIQGLEQRAKLDKIACSLVNKRDRLLRIATNNAKQSPTSKGMVPKAMTTLRQLDEALDDCLKLIENYTGYFIVNLNWSCDQVNPLIKINGFRVYVNGKQYGSDLNNTIRSIRVKLSLEKAINTLYVTSFTEKPKMESNKSNRIEFMSEKFFPFSFFCLSNVHQKSVSWPEPGCCSYRDTIEVERVNLSRNREAINIGLIAEPILASNCQVIDVASGKSSTLFENKSENTTVVFFWTKWCLPSIRILNFLIMYVQRVNPSINFVICHCGNENPTEMQALLKQVGYTHPSIRFVIDIQLGNSKTSIDSLDIKGTPSMIVVNSSGYIIWKGRHCVYDYPSFEQFFNHTISECEGTKCPVNNCNFCINDISVEKDLIDVRSMLTLFNQYSETLERPPEVYQPRAKKQDKITTKQLISSKMSTTEILRPGSENGSDLLSRSNKSLKTSRSGSIDQLGYCYYHKKTSK